MASGGPWGGKGGSGRDDEQDDSARPAQGSNGGRRPEHQGSPPEIEDILKKGQDRLRAFMGGGKGRGGGGSSAGGGEASPGSGKGVVAVVLLGLVVAWGITSLYTVKPEERSVQLFLGKFSSYGNPGLNFAPWPVMSAEVVEVTSERQTDIGSVRGDESGLMLTRDQNIVDIGFQVIWNIDDPAKYLFNLADPIDTIRAVSESAMRDIIARSELAPILNRDRGAIATDVQAQIQSTLDSYDSGLRVIRVNFETADPPREVIDAFREVQAAQQKRDRLEKEADAYANRVTAEARGDAARLFEEAEGYRASVVNDARGEASRFVSVYNEYAKAPDVTRRRMYLETMERVYGSIDKILLDGGGGGGGAEQDVVPYLPLNDLLRFGNSGATNSGATRAGDK